MANRDNSAPKKGGLSKQLKRKMAANLPLYNPVSYAGLPPAMYINLQTLQSAEEVNQRQNQGLRHALENLKVKADRIQGAFDAATETISKFKADSDDYTNMLLILDVTSQHLAEVGQQITKLEDLMASNSASINLAFGMQMAELYSHRAVFGRIDANDERPPVASRRGLRLRSTNVPSPSRSVRSSAPGPSRPLTPPPSPKPKPPMVQTSITDYMPPEYGTLDTTVLNTPENQVVFQRCEHFRLHRLLVSADKNAKKMLKQSCRNRCKQGAGKVTLCPPKKSCHPLPVAPTPANLPKTNQEPSEVIEVVTISSAESVQPATSTETIRSSPSTIEISSSPQPQASSDSVIEQIDGLNNVRKLDFSTNDSDFDLSLVASLPVNSRGSYRDFDDEPNGPKPCEDVFGRRTPCHGCSMWEQDGFCFCNCDEQTITIRRPEPGVPDYFAMSMSNDADVEKPDINGNNITAEPGE